ncbi:hypothetical protein GIB67_028116 [Kingdonia uniflora]|uniref:Uncharacterized protein n=1 Tax=Kingdonia uniflora TaxID=39325 RepID=A0A7J7LQL6_9MAGN|nr:hypothetical protein GIB67_028116 [Kingdonia uniflora]
MMILQIRYFETKVFLLPTPILLFLQLSWDVAGRSKEADDDYHQMWRFNYMVLFAAYRRSCLRILVEDAVARRMRRPRCLLLNALKNPKPSSKFIVSTSSEESSSSDKIWMIRRYPENVDVAKNFLQYKRSLYGKWRHYVMNAGLLFRTLTALVHTPPVRTEGVNADVNLAPPLKKQKKVSGKDIPTSSKGVDLKAVEQKALDLAKRDPIHLDTQIQSSISQSVAEVLKVAAADHTEYETEKTSLAEYLKERTALCEQLQKEKVLQKEQFEKEEALLKDQFEKEAAATKKEVEDEAKKAVDIVVASRNKLIQAFYFRVLSRVDVDLALAGSITRSSPQGMMLSPVAEQSPTPPVADDTTKEAEVDSERGLKEAYLDLLTERDIVPDSARVKFLAQEARNRQRIEAQRCSARAGVSIIWGGVGPLPDELDFCRGKEQ